MVGVKKPTDMQYKCYQFKTIGKLEYERMNKSRSIGATSGSLFNTILLISNRNFRNLCKNSDGILKAFLSDNMSTPWVLNEVKRVGNKKNNEYLGVSVMLTMNMNNELTESMLHYGIKNFISYVADSMKMVADDITIDFINVGDNAIMKDIVRVRLNGNYVWG